MSIFQVGGIIAYVILLFAFGVTYYTNDKLLKHNVDLFGRLQACQQTK